MVGYGERMEYGWVGAEGNRLYDSTTGIWLVTVRIQIVKTCMITAFASRQLIKQNPLENHSGCLSSPWKRDAKSP